MSIPCSILLLSDCSTRFPLQDFGEVPWLICYVPIVLWDFIYFRTDSRLMSLGYLTIT